MTVRSCAFVHPVDVTLSSQDAGCLAAMADACASRAISSLEAPSGGYSELQRRNIALKFHCMQGTLRHVRKIVGAGFQDPCSVDALAVARLNVEDLFALCLMFEEPRWVQIYLQDGWRKSYTRHLLQAEETKNIPRFDAYSHRVAPENLRRLQQLVGITDAQMMTVRAEELGEQMPPGVIRDKIERFPTPHHVIGKLQRGEPKRNMLERFYMEYRYLSSFSHGLTEAMLFKTMFNKAPLLPHQFSEAQRKDTWQRAVAERSFLAAILSLVQAAAELLALYPNDVELRLAASRACSAIAEGHLLGKAIWNIRTTRLLGVLECGPNQTAEIGS